MFIVMLFTVLRGEFRPICCNTRLTVRHVLLSCAKYVHIRRKYFSFNFLFQDTPAGFIIQFIRECNLCCSAGATTCYLTRYI